MASENQEEILSYNNFKDENGCFSDRFREF
ncbi:MAG: type II toxin-antitoxin system CcdA family antitoxin [Gammaproteobacteria bacterium]|nr:type II toxin-antitoxin system CcdA family antitoxin [Gammaproteobacteria bacterium]